MPGRERHGLATPIAGTLLVHLLAAAAVYAAGRLADRPDRSAPVTVAVQVLARRAPAAAIRATAPPAQPEVAREIVVPPPPPPPPRPPDRPPPRSAQPAPSDPGSPRPADEPGPRPTPPDPPAGASPAPGAPETAADPAPSGLRGAGAAPPGALEVTPGGSSPGSAHGTEGGAETDPRGVRGGSGGGPGPGGDAVRPAAAGAIRTPARPRGRYEHELMRAYPEAARRAGVEGHVVVTLLVDARGSVVEVELVEGLGYGLDELALAFGRKLRFEPARDGGGHAVASRLTWKFRFSLDD